MRILLLILLLPFLYSCTDKNSQAMSPSELSQALIGEYDNFQQCWQENTEEEIHRLKVSKMHKHIHVAIGVGTNENEFSY